MKPLLIPSSLIQGGGYAMDDLSMLQPKNDDDGRFGKTDWGGELEGYLQVRLAKVIHVICDM